MSKTRNTGNLTDVITAGSTYATGATPPQFDNSLNQATTGFVRQALGSRSSIIGITVPTTLTTANAGQLITFNASVAITLPLASTFPSGTSVEFFSGASGASVVRQGSDTISNGTSLATSVTLGIGDTLTLVSNSVGWFVQGGSAQLPFASVFASTLAGTGWQKLPSGLIMQWNGNYTTSTSGATKWTFPIAFPNGILTNLGSPQSSSATGTTVGFTTGTTTGVFVTATTSGAFVAISTCIVVMGY